MEISNEDLAVLQEKSAIGDKLKEFRISREYGILEEHILQPLEKEAFTAFTRVKPDETIEIIQTQMMQKIVSKIRAMIESRIQEGNLALQTLKTLPTEDE